MITQDQVKDLFEYRNGDLYWKVANNKKIKIGNKAGTADFQGYLRTRINRKPYLNHRIIFLWHYGYLPQCIDHKDCNPSNNKIENLREATNSQNSCNAKTFSTNTSGVKGVYWSNRDKKWRVTLSLNGRRMYFGCYDNLEQAKLVIQKARLKCHGQFANHGEVE